MMKKKQVNAIMIVRMYNHTTNEDFQFEVSETMIYLCNKVIQELVDDYKTCHTGELVQYLDFHQGRGYPGEIKK